VPAGEIEVMHKECVAQGEEGAANLGFREIGEGEEVLSGPKALPRTPPPPGSA
jgi:hypothetical protein